jgi:glycosyltransferase involved in cell wall biosynthesis
MKVLKIIHTSGHGGAENTFRRLAKGLIDKGVDVVAGIPLVTDLSMENWVEPALLELKIPFQRFDVTGSPLQLLRNIAALIDEIKPDIVHSHLLDSNFYSALVCRLRFLPHICTEHGDVSFKQNAVSRLKYLSISLTSRTVICVSDAVRECAAPLIPAKCKLKTIHNGVRFMERIPSLFRTEYDIPEGALLIGNVGNLYPVKGQKFLIKAFSEILSSHPDSFLAIVGRGEEGHALRDLARELKIPAHRIIFTGFRNDIENIMNAFDLYVQPSLSEGHPIAVLEAMSLGIPVIATNVGGIPEILGRDVYGKLVAKASWEDLARAIREYLAAPGRFRDRAQDAKEFTHRAYSIERMASDYIKVYQDCLTGRQKQP